MIRQYRNILVHSLVNIGDVLLSTSAVALLRQAYPQARITMMVRPVAADMLQDHPLIDEVLIFDYKGKTKSLLAQWNFLQELRKRQYDLVISFDRKSRPALLSWLAGIPTRVVPDRIFDNVPSWVTRLYNHVIPIPFDLANHLQADTYQEIVRKFVDLQGQANPVLGNITAQHEEKAQQLLAMLPNKQQRIALCIKGTFALKSWPPERFAELTERLNACTDAAFFIVGAPEDREYAENFIAKTKVSVANFCGQTSLRSLAALVKKADLLITVDTGGTHIAATTGVPMIVVYGCTSPKRWAPYNPNAITISKEPDCCPCTLPEDGCDMKKCLLAISVDEVYEQACTLLERTATS